jgi:PAS domain S-box-containing protein
MLTETTTAATTSQPQQNWAKALNGQSQSDYTASMHSLDESSFEAHAWIESVAVSVFAMDMSQYVTAWNRRTSEITGISAQDILHQPLNSVLQETSIGNLKRAMLDISLGRDAASCDLYLARNSSLGGFHVKLSAQQNAAGQTIGIICFAEDKAPPLAEPRPEESSAQIDTTSKLFASFDFPAFGVDLDGTVNLWNDSMAAITRYAKEDVWGRLFVEFIETESQCQQVQQLFFDAASGESTSPYKLDFRGKHGRIKQLLLNISPKSNDHQKLSGAIVVVTDVTERPYVSSCPEDKEFGEFVDNAPVPIFSLVGEGIINQWNPKISDLTGFTKEDVMGSSFVGTLVSPAFQSRTREFLNHCSLGNKSSLETQVQKKSGQSLRLLLRVSLQREEGGKMVGLVVFAQDQTVNAIADNSSVNELEQLIESANAPIFGVDLNGHINLWNSMSAEILGLSRDFVIGESLVETFIDPSLRQSVEAVLDMALQGNGTSNYELEFQTKSGESRYMLVNITPRRDGNDDIVGAVGFAHDVTEAAQHDRAVAAMARELRQLLDTVNTPIFGVNSAGHVNEWNDQTAEITGFSKDEAFNQPLVEKFILPALRPAVQEVIANALRGRGTTNFELEIWTKENEVRYLLLNAMTRRDAENNVAGVVAVAQDVTEACKHDRAVAAMANELRRLIDTANAPIFGIDRDGYVRESICCTCHQLGSEISQLFILLMLLVT